MQGDINISEETLQKIAAANRANPYVDMTPCEVDGGIPIINYSGFLTQPRESILYAAPAQTFKDKSQAAKYTGKSAGVIFYVEKGVIVRNDNSVERPTRGTVRVHNFGDLIITNKRVVFIGKDDSFDFSIEEISTIKILDKQSFVLQSGQIVKNIAMKPAIIEYAINCISYVQKEVAAGIDVYQNHQMYQNPQMYQNHQITPTPEQIVYSEPMRQEHANVRVPKKKYKYGWLWTIVEMLFRLLILVTAIAIIIWIIMTIGRNSGSLGDNQTVDTIMSAAELVAFEGHPRIYDSYAEAQTFYDDIADNRVAVLEIRQKARIERNLDNLYDDEIVLYMIKHSTKKEYIGTIEINIFDPQFAADMTIEGATNIAVSYLPKDFFEYYASDASYFYENGGTKIYTYSCRLNDEGVEYRRSVAPQYSYYYNIKIYEYADGEHWKIITGYGAYGDNDKGWIEKYAEPWEAPIQNK